MIKSIKQNIKKFLTIHMDLKPLERYVADINLDCTRQQKRVLISYLDFFRSGRDVTLGTVHTNRYELFQIIQGFISNGYVVDVCACEDMDAMEIIEKKQYDVIFGMGEVFRKAVIKQKEAFSVLYLTENPYYVSCQKEQERLDYFYERRKIRKQLYRTGRIFQKDDEKKVDAIICNGDESYLKNTDIPVYRLIPSAFVNRDFTNTFSQRKRTNFLVFGTAGFIHKGNDLLVEVFQKHPEWNLYLCGHDISNILDELGYGRNNFNIHDCGYVDVYSSRFLELAKKCVYILLPSCSEGMPTAVLTGMRHGMIPIVSKGNGLECIQEHCFFFDGYKLDDIEQKLMQAAEIPIEELKEKSQQISDFANESFTLDKFTNEFKIILAELFKEEFI